MSLTIDSYEPDEIDPTRMAESGGDDEWEDERSDQGVDYRILSKSLRDG